MVKPRYFLPQEFEVSEEFQKALNEDYNRLIEEPESHIKDRYNIDVSSFYGPFKIKNPFGKASGQLSTNKGQVMADIEGGLGFTVLKTVIAEDQDKKAEMDQWKIHAPKMVVEKLVSKNGEEGYSVVWKGRGWEKSLDDYLDFFDQCLAVAGEYPIIPSVKYHLPGPSEEYKLSEYTYTTQKLLEVWKKHKNEDMVMEKDFSPTFAGTDVAGQKDMIISWLQDVPRLIKQSVDEPIHLGVKMMNATLEDEFQRELVREFLGKDSSWLGDFAICFNRLFDHNKEFEGKVGVAYGGYDLSDRNLWALEEVLDDKPSRQVSATGNICSGKMMLEYALRGAVNGQMHTFFQIPQSEYAPIDASRTRKAVHELLFNPQKGLVAGLIYIREKLGKGTEPFTFLEVTDLNPYVLVK
ncbi:MAG: hypothetical protein QM371_06990 [Bacillota bacterium]|nr:hypothetical protein [Bacillota bacterium]